MITINYKVALQIDEHQLNGWARRHIGMLGRDWIELAFMDRDQKEIADPEIGEAKKLISKATVSQV